MKSTSKTFGLTYFTNRERIFAVSELPAQTPGMLIDALGGTNSVATLFGVGVPAVCNWRNRGFPAWTHTRLAELCTERCVEFDAALLRGAPPGRRQAEAAS